MGWHAWPLLLVALLGWLVLLPAQFGHSTCFDKLLTMGTPVWRYKHMQVAHDLLCCFLAWLLTP